MTSKLNFLCCPAKSTWTLGLVKIGVNPSFSTYYLREYFLFWPVLSFLKWDNIKILPARNIKLDIVQYIVSSQQILLRISLFNEWLLNNREKKPFLLKWTFTSVLVLDLIRTFQYKYKHSPINCKKSVINPLLAWELQVKTELWEGVLKVLLLTFW